MDCRGAALLAMTERGGLVGVAALFCSAEVSFIVVGLSLAAECSVFEGAHKRVGYE